MIYVIANSVLKPGMKDEFLKIFKANIPNVLAEDGCIFTPPAPMWIWAKGSMKIL